MKFHFLSEQQYRNGTCLWEGELYVLSIREKESMDTVFSIP